MATKPRTPLGDAGGAGRRSARARCGLAVLAMESRPARRARPHACRAASGLTHARIPLLLLLLLISASAVPARISRTRASEPGGGRRGTSPPPGPSGAGNLRLRPADD
eukprot:scaffold4395_cov411-Prasinococcus_capsulatus_cf.AAC.6